MSANVVLHNDSDGMEVLAAAAPDPVPVTEVSAAPAAPPAAQTPALAAQDDVQDIVRSALNTVVGDLQADLEKYVQTTVRAKIEGQHASLVPTISTVTQTGKRITIADAKNRAFRTLFQNLAVDLMVGLITVLPMLVTMNFTDRSAWIVFGTSLLKTVIAVFVSYVSRLAVTPSIPTPVYPLPTSAPAAT